MKTIKNKLVLVAFVLVTLFGYANNNSFSPKNDEKIVRVIFEDVKKGHFLTIKDEFGVVLHSETIEKNGTLNKVFDFSTLENGTYIFELEKDFQIIIKSFEVKNNVVIYSEKTEEVIFKPIVRNESNTLLISKIAFDAQPMQVVIYYNNEVIFSETIKEDKIINRVYKLDNEKEGDYKTSIFANGRNYVKNFKI